MQVTTFRVYCYQSVVKDFHRKVVHALELGPLRCVSSPIEHSFVEALSGP